MSKSCHLAFRKEYPDISFRLTTEAGVSDISSQKFRKVTALWDTGATGSAITPDLAQKMNLVPISRIKVNGVNNISIADVVKINAELPNQVVLRKISVAVCNLVAGVDMLIGMDIILLGDFSISNGDGKTLFSFVIPPFENKTDHYEKALAVNKRNKV